jgi:hypothetical protein
MGTRFLDINDPAESTCQWINSDPDYVAWQQAKNGILWIKGNPGAGKSTLMKYAFQNRPQGVASACYFFNRRGAALEHNLIGCYRSLLHELLPLASTQLSRLTLIYEERCEKRGTCGEKWDWHEAELKKFLSET